MRFVKMETLIGRMLFAAQDLPVYMIYQSHLAQFGGVGIITKSSVVGEGFVTLLPYLLSKISAKNMSELLGWYDVESKNGSFAINIDNIDINWLNVWTAKDFIQKIGQDFDIDRLIDMYDAEEAYLSMNGDSLRDPSVTRRQLDLELDLYMAGKL